MKTHIIISVVVSLFISMVLVKGCFSGVFPKFICNSGNQSSAYIKLDTSHIKETKSQIDEHAKYSIELGNIAKNLVDGNEKTLAAPASNKIDYIVNLADSYKIKSIDILWQGYDYITSWSLEASSDGKSWQEIHEEKNAPGAKTTIDSKFSASYIRLKAESENNWIGAYELSIIGKPAE